MPNLSQFKRERMLAFLQKIKDEHRDDDDMLIALGEIESELTSKKYGLVWEQHEETVDVMMRDNIPVFTEVPEREITTVPGQSYNFILEGDNLHSLRLLEKTHKGKIDLIYIDPPYNTGNKDFVYDDAFVDKTDLFSHSKWLSFMEKRLRIARNLLSDRGVIFISIDDNEEAPLQLLCDDIFGASCFVANIAWQRTYSTRNDSDGIPSETEHILVYSKNAAWNPKLLPRTASMNSKYKNPDNDVADWRTDNAYAAEAATHQGMVYAIQHPFTGELLYPANGLHWRYKQSEMLEIMRGWCDYELQDLDDAAKRAEVCGVKEPDVRHGVLGIVLSESLEVSREKAQAVYERGQWPKYFFTKGGYGGIAKKTYLDTAKGRLPSNFWPHVEVGHTDEAKKELKAIFSGKIPFDTPKPTRLIERILEIASYDDSIILDFFAGSGTTGHGVLKFNATHPDSKRRFILCTNNEGDICENVTFPRVKVVSTGKTPDGDAYIFTTQTKEQLMERKITLADFKESTIYDEISEIKKNSKGMYEKFATEIKDGSVYLYGIKDIKAFNGIPTNVKYYRTDFVSKDDEYLSDALLEHIREMIQLEHGVKIDGSQYLMVMSDEEADELQAHWSEYEGVRAIYASKEVLFTTEQNALFAGVEIHTIPDYYFNFELKEVGETW